MNIHDSKFLITGGTLGIGRTTAELLLKAGGKVAITGRDSERTRTAAKDIGAFAITADVSNAREVERTYAEFLEEFGSLDCLINNAGIGIHKPLLELTEEEMLEVWRTNVLGASLMAQHAARLFVAQNKGNIVNISSTSGLRGYERGTAYVASKFALRGMTECWRAELRKHNVRVVLVNPSEVTTAFGNPEREERAEQANKLRSLEIAHAIKSALEMDDRGFIPELSVFATNPW